MKVTKKQQWKQTPLVSKREEKSRHRQCSRPQKYSKPSY